MRKTKLTLIVLVMLVVVDTLAQRSRRRPVNTPKKMSTGLQLPVNATSIRQNIVDTFSCENRIYGFYADIDNECQVFHVCMPQTRRARRFSFICPPETIFNQPMFVCTRSENSIPCEDSQKYYELNEAFGKEKEKNQGTQNHDNAKPTTPQTRKQTKGTTKRPMISSSLPPPKPVGKSSSDSAFNSDHHSTQNPPKQSKLTTNYPGFTTDQQTIQYSQTTAKPATIYPSSTSDYQLTQLPPKPVNPISFKNFVPSHHSTQFPQKNIGSVNHPIYVPDFQTTQFTQRPPQLTQHTKYWIPFFK